MKKIWFFIIICFSMSMLSIHADAVDVIIYVQNEQQEALQNVKLQIVNDKTHHSTYYKSDRTGEIIIKDISVGSYTIKIDDYKSYKAQPAIDFSVTTYSIGTGTELTLVLKHTTSKDKIKDYAILFWLLAILNVAAYYTILIFQNKTFTQFLDDIMI